MIGKKTKGTLISVLILLCVTVPFSTFPVEGAILNEVKVLILTNYSPDQTALPNLLRGEGAEVELVYSSGDIPPPSLLQQYDLFILSYIVTSFWIGAFTPVIDEVQTGKGILILSTDTGLLSIAGVVPDTNVTDYLYDWDAISDRKINHTINGGVRSIKLPSAPTVPAYPLKLASSNATPIAVEYGGAHGVDVNLTLAAANDAVGKGSAVAVGDNNFGSDGSLSLKDNALFIRNAAYWLSGVEVPPFNPELPDLISLESTLSTLKNNVTSLNDDIANLTDQLDKFRENLTNIPEFQSISQNLSEISSELNNLNQQLTQLQMLSYVAMAIAGIAIIVSLIRKKI